MPGDEDSEDKGSEVVAVVQRVLDDFIQGFLKSVLSDVRRRRPRFQHGQKVAEIDSGRLFLKAVKGSMDQ